jgi:translocator protein
MLFPIKMDNYQNYITSFLFVFIVASMSTYFTNQSVKSSWYNCVQPSITPPRIVFPIVWTTLYVFIAIAFAKDMNTSYIRNLFIANLLLNVLWCWVFFVVKNPIMSLPCIFAILLTIVEIKRKTKNNTVEYLMYPYIIWISF